MEKKDSAIRISIIFLVFSLTFSHCALAFEAGDPRLGRWKTAKIEDGGLGALTLDVIACQQGLCAIAVENGICKHRLAEPVDPETAGQDKSDFFLLTLSNGSKYVVEMNAYKTHKNNFGRQDSSQSAPILQVYGVTLKEWRYNAAHFMKSFSQRSFPSISADLEYAGPAQCQGPMS